MPPKKDKPKPFRYQGLISVKLFHSPLKTKKYRAVFQDDGVKFHHTDFGAKSYRDFTLINDPDSQYQIPNKDDREEVKQNYIQRHRPNEDWNDPYSAGALSFWVLWNKPTLELSWKDYKQKFNLQ